MINYWLSVNESIYADTIAYAKDSENYLGSHPVEDVKALINGLHDTITVLSMFKPYQSRRLLTVYSSDQNLFEGLMAKYSDTVVLGGWDMTGKQVAPVHIDTINYMPDSFLVTDELTGEGVSEPAVELSQVNLLGGQSGRDLS